MVRKAQSAYSSGASKDMLTDMDKEIMRKLELKRRVDRAIHHIRNMSKEEFKAELEKHGMEFDDDDKYPHQEK